MQGASRDGGQWFWQLKRKKKGGGVNGTQKNYTAEVINKPKQQCMHKRTIFILISKRWLD